MGADVVAEGGAGEETGSEGDGLRAGPPVDLVFLPGDPPRSGTFAAYLAPGAFPSPAAWWTDGETGSPGHRRSARDVPVGHGEQLFGESVELVLTAGRSVRRREVPAHVLTVPEAVGWLLQFDPSWHAQPSVVAWSDALLAGLGVLAGGRLFPSVSPCGWDAWRAGPLRPDDLRLLESIGARMPPSAHCVPLEGRAPLRVMSPVAAARALWDAVADTLVRTDAAPVLAGSDLFAAAAPTDARFLATWLADSAQRPVGSARVGLRIVLDGATDGADADADAGVDGDGDRAVGIDGDVDEDADGADGHADEDADGEDGDADADGDSGGDAEAGPVAVVQMTSVLDPSLVVDADALFSMPPAVLARLDPDAEANLLLALRRGSRAWAPLGALLAQRIPASLALTDEDVEDLLADGADALGAVGIDVLWPSSLLFEGLTLQAVLRSPPKIEGDGTFSLQEMVKFDWRLALGGESLSAEELDQLAEAKRTIVRLRGRWVHVDASLLERARQRREHRLTAIEALAAAMAGEMVADGEKVAVVADGAIAGFAERLHRIADAGPTALGPPPGFAGELRPYQERGVAWLHQMCELGLGACLADDMGLGKTVQVIGLQLHRAAATPGRVRRGTTVRSRPRRGRDAAAASSTALIVCPTSLLGNWARELHRFAPGLPVRRFYGPERTLEDLRDGEVVVTSYGVARRDRDLLAGTGFSLVVADEAQHAKNPLSDTARALRAIGGQHRVALTGTPVENRLTELWSIIDWTTPGLLGPLERFRRTVALPVEKRRDPEVTERLTRTVRPFLLRRKKTDPAIAPELPPRTVSDLPVALTPEQVTLYEAEVREAMDAIRRKSGIERQGLVFRLMTVLKQICNHPAQYLHQSGPIAGRSGKLAALEELLGVILEEGESVLVFSQYVGLCSLLEARLAELGVGTVFLHGSVPAHRRDDMVAAFQSGKVPVFLLSLKAGGVGLNLTRATHVVHYDRWWNPAVEDQATDRAHRIGQDRPVQVHRLVAEGTLEDRIAELLERKRDLAEAVVGDGEAWITELSDDELAALVTLGAS